MTICELFPQRAVKPIMRPNPYGLLIGNLTQRQLAELHQLVVKDKHPSGYRSVSRSTDSESGKSTGENSGGSSLKA